MITCCSALIGLNARDGRNGLRYAREAKRANFGGTHTHTDRPICMNLWGEKNKKQAVVSVCVRVRLSVVVASLPTQNISPSSFSSRECGNVASTDFERADGHDERTVGQHDGLACVCVERERGAASSTHTHAPCAQCVCVWVKY